MDQGVYKIINVVNNKFYIGSAVSFRKRKARHFSELRTGKHNNRHLQAAWDKYGEQAFVFVVVEEVPERENLLEVENRWLKDHVGKDHCYNIGRDATAPMLGVKGKLSPTWGMKRTPQQLAAQSWAGRKHTPESREKIRQRLLGKPRPAEVRAKISTTLSGAGNPNFGKPRSDDFKAKVSKPVVAVDPIGAETTYPSIVALRGALGLKPTTVNRAVKTNRPLTRGPFKGWCFRYL